MGRCVSAEDLQQYPAATVHAHPNASSVLLGQMQHPRSTAQHSAAQHTCSFLMVISRALAVASLVTALSCACCASLSPTLRERVH